MGREGMRRAALLAVAALLPAGCAVGPDYRQPAVEIPAAYKELNGWKTAQPRDHETRGNWWEIFGDPLLNSLEERISVSNQTLFQSEAQFRQALALVQAARAGAFPLVTGSVSVTRSGSPSVAGRPAVTATSHALALDAGWEADIWGRVRRLVEANRAAAEASAADIEAVRLSLQATLAQNYLLLRVADLQKRLLDETAAGFARSLQLVENQYAAGVVAKGDVYQAQAQLRATQAQAVDVGVQRAQLEHAVAVLIGIPPAEFAIPAEPATPIIPDAPVGIPSELLERRPDIAAAERRIAAANAQIGVARAAFFPALTLSASLGLQSPSFADWLTAPSRFWSIGPALLQPLFDAGLRRAQSNQAIAFYDATVAAYRQAVLGSFQEVEDNLAALRLLSEEAQLQEDAVQAARRALAVATNQYRAGTVSYLNVVTAQTTALNNERTAVAILGRRLTASVLLVRALGGGWSAPERTSRR